MPKFRIPHSVPWITDEDVENAARSMRSGWLTCGPYVEQLEAELCRISGAACAVCVSSGTAALLLAMQRATSTQKYAYIPSMTFSATVHVARLLSELRITWIDCTLDGTMDPEILDEIASGAVDRAIVVPVHIGGRPVGGRCRTVADRHGMRIVQDSAQAMPTDAQQWLDNECACLSFFPTKLITAGEGGAILTNSQVDATWFRSARSHHTLAGRHPWNRDSQELGLNFRMSDPSAALALGQAKRFDEIIARRRALASRYHVHLSGPRCPAGVIPLGDLNKDQFQMYQVLVPSEKRDSLILQLRAGGIEASVHYDPPCHRQHAFAKIPWRHLPVTDHFSKSVVTLPIYPTMTLAQVDEVVEAIRSTEILT